MAKFFIGTAGWTYQDWIGKFYPEPQSPNFDWLRYYSELFNVIEVNATYYTFIHPKVVEGWVNKVSEKPDFRFIVKMHNSFTHGRFFNTTDIKKITDNLTILKRSGKLSGTLLQFPYSFSYNDHSRKVLYQLVNAFRDYSPIMEVRHSSWINDAALTYVKDNSVTFACIDQPSLGKALPFTPILTSDKVYIRLHGRNTEAWQKSIQNYGKKLTYEEQNERYNYLYSFGELNEILQKAADVISASKEVFIILNNHPHGNAPVNAYELMELLKVKDSITINEVFKTFIKSLNRVVFSE